jgi:hypothetical protein
MSKPEACEWLARFNQVVLKLNGTYHLQVYADDVNLLGDNIDYHEEKHRKSN